MRMLVQVVSTLVLQTGLTAMHYAAQEFQLDVVAWLVEAGMDPNVVDVAVCECVLLEPV